MLPENAIVSNVRSNVKSLSGRLTGDSGRVCYQLKAFHTAAVNTPVNIYTQGLGDKQLESSN